MRYAARTDANKHEIVDYLLSMGCSVYDMRQPVDLLVGANGRTCLVELKDGSKPPSKRKYTKAQQAFMALVAQPLHLCRPAKGLRQRAQLRVVAGVRTLQDPG